MHAEEDDPPAGVPLRAVPDLRCDDNPAVAQQLPRLRHALAGWAAKAGLRPELVEAVVLAADEAMSNVVSHAYPGGTGTFDLRAVYRPGRVSVTVRDHGRWRPAPTNPGLLHGRGLLLIRALAGGVTINRGPKGTTVTMVWSLPAGR